MSCEFAQLTLHLERQQLMEYEYTLLDYWQVISRWRKTIVLVVGVLTVASVITSLYLPKSFKAQATIMPVGGQRAGVLASMALGDQGGLLGSLMPESSSAPEIMAILKSRTLAERIIETHGLMKVFYRARWDKRNQKWKTKDPRKIPRMEDALKRLKSKVTFLDNRKTKVIAIRSVMPDAELAASVANGYVQELADYVSENTLTAAKRNRIFIEGQLQRNKADLLESGSELNQFYAVNRISDAEPVVNVDISLDVQGIENVSISAQNGLRARGPEALSQVQKETEKTQEELAKAKAQIQRANVVKGVPQQVYLQYLSLRNKLLEKMNTLLTQQYEMAKIEEAKEDLNFQIIDQARVPYRKYKPKRAQIVIVTFLTSLLGMCVFAFFMEHLKRIKRQSRQEID